MNTRTRRVRRLSRYFRYMSDARIKHDVQRIAA